MENRTQIKYYYIVCKLFVVGTTSYELYQNFAYVYLGSLNFI